MLFNYGDKNEKSEQPVGQPSNPVLHVETAADVGAASPVFIYYWFWSSVCDHLPFLRVPSYPRTHVTSVAFIFL